MTNFVSNCLRSHCPLKYWIAQIAAFVVLHVRSKGAGTGGAGGAIAPPIFLEIGEKIAFSTPNISRSKEGTAPESH